MIEITHSDGPLSDEQRAAIRTHLANWQGATEMSSAAIARSVGIARTTFAAVVKGTYPHDMDGHLRRIAAWLADQLDREPAPGVAFAETSIARRILSACYRAAEMPTIAVIMAPAGIGKSLALDEFVARRQGRATLIQAGEDNRSVANMRRVVARALGVPMSGSVGAQMDAIRERLAGYYAGGASNPYTLVVDEATTLSARTVNWMRNLHDAKSCRVGLVLADTWRFEHELSRADGIRGGAEQLWRRAGAQVRLPESELISNADVDLVTDAIVRSIGHDPAVLDGHARAYLRKAAQRPGKLGNVHQRLQAVADCAAGIGVAPTFSAAQLDYVSDMLGQTRKITHGGDPFTQGGRRSQTTSTQPACRARRAS